MKALIERLKEPSTWAGLGGLAVALGMTQESFNELVMAVTGAVGFVAAVFLGEKRQKVRRR